MTRCRKIALTFALFLPLSHCVAHTEPYDSKEYHDNYLIFMSNKFYVESETIYIATGAIFLNISGEFVSVKNLFSDDKGIFVLADEILTAKSKDGHWICAWCGESNNGGNYCKTCYKIRRDN